MHVFPFKSHPTLVQVKISQLAEYRSQRVKVFGWVHRLRDQKGIIFIVLRDGTGYLQSLLSGKLVCIFPYHPYRPSLRTR